MQKEKMTFADEVREAVQGYRGEAFKVHSLADKMDLNQTKKKRLYSILNLMVTRDNEAKKIKPGVYCYIGREKLPMEQVAWKILRARKRVTVPDLVELVGMKESYARSWFKMLEERGLVKKVGGGGHYNGAEYNVWQLTHDPIKMPANTRMIEKHRQLKANRLSAMAKIEVAEKALSEARELLTDGGDA